MVKACLKRELQFIYGIRIQNDGLLVLFLFANKVHNCFPCSDVDLIIEKGGIEGTEYQNEQGHGPIEFVVMVKSN